MIVGIGTDIVEVERIAKAIDRYGDRFAQRILCPIEFQTFLRITNRERFLAKRFAAKEAIVKALGTGFRQGISWQHLEVKSHSLGQPFVDLKSNALNVMREKKINRIHLSISDEIKYAVAFVVCSS